MFLGLGILVVVAIIAWMILKPSSPRADPPPAEAQEEGPQDGPSGAGTQTGSPGTGPQDMDTFRAALGTLDDRALQDMLDMGATLKPGTEDAIREELRRRQIEE